MRSRNNYGRLKGRSCLCLLATPKSVKTCPSSSKPSKRQSSTIRFVHDLRPGSILNINEESRWRSKKRLVIRNSHQ